METRLETKINKEAENIASMYGLTTTQAKIFLMKGITIYQDYIIEGWKYDIRWSTSNETERRR